MRKEEIIALAREAGGGLESDYTNITALERFAKLVAEHEREQCAQVCDEHSEFPSLTPRHCAEAIRARKEQA